MKLGSTSTRQQDMDDSEIQERQRAPRAAASCAALAVLDQMTRTAGDVAFPRFMTRCCLRVAARRIWGRAVTVHGFRSALKTWAAETDVVRTRCDRESRWAHTIGGKLEKAYRRGDLLEKRTRLMNAWADFCNGRTGTSTVIPAARLNEAAPSGSSHPDRA